MSDSTDIPEGYKATVLGVLPDDWDIVNLGEVVQKTSTLNPNKNPDYEFDYIDVSSVSSDTLTIESTTRCIAHSCSSRARKIVEENDVIFATIRPSLRRVSLVPKKLNNHICSTAFCVLRSNPKKIDPSFLFYAVSFGDFVDRISEHQQGVAYPAITNKDVHDELIPLPPLPEQRAIAATLRTVQEAKEKTDAVIAATKALKAAMMKHLFTKNAERFFNLDEWTDCCLGDIINLKRGYDLPNSERVFGEYPVISSSGIFCYHKEPKVKGPGVVTGRYGTLGEVFYVEGDYWPLNTTLYVQDFKENYPRYISYLLQSMSLGEHNFASSVPGVNRNILHQLPVKIPPKIIQEKIADILYVIDQKLAAEQSHKEALDTLFTSLLHDLMTAKIRVNPAEVA